MKHPLPEIRSILSIPTMYNLFSKLVAGDAFYEYVEKYVRPKESDKILDIGCGTGNILEYLPRVKYVGFDISQDYIDNAIKRFGNCGTFLCKKVSREAIQDRETFDIVLATAVLHHLNDDEALQLFELAQSVLKPSGRLVTFDNCYVEGSSTRISRTDVFGNTYQQRNLEDGSVHEVLKNFPSESQLRRAVEGMVREVRIQILRYYWILSYGLK